eukprot:jgi/Hompol1/5703/HPOL_001104-RA
MIRWLWTGKRETPNKSSDASGERSGINGSNASSSSRSASSTPADWLGPRTGQRSDDAELFLVLDDSLRSGVRSNNNNNGSSNGGEGDGEGDDGRSELAEVSLFVLSERSDAAESDDVYYDAASMISGLSGPSGPSPTTAATAAATTAVGNARQADAASTHTVETIYFPRHNPQTTGAILPFPLAYVVSSVSTASRLSLKIANVITDTAFESLRFGAATTIGLGRRAMVSAISSARSLHAAYIRRGESASEHDRFFDVLNSYTDAGIYVIHNAFSLTELLTLSSFHMASSTIKVSLRAAEECVQTLDALFGETDTSKTLAAFICIFLEQWRGQDDALGLDTRIGKLIALGQITKAMTAFCCLQFVTRKHWRSRIKLDPVFIGRAPKSTTYDPSSEAFSLNIFNTSGPMAPKSQRSSFSGENKSATWPDESSRRRKLQLRRSLDALSLPYRITPVSTSSRYYEPVAPAPDSGATHRRSSSSVMEDTDSLVNVVRMLDAAKHIRRSSMPMAPKQTPLLPSIPERTSAKQPSTPVTVEQPPDSRTEDSWVIHADEHVEMAARFIKFAIGSYGTGFLRIMGLGNARDHTLEWDGEHHNHQSLAFHANVPVEHIVTSSFLNQASLEPPGLNAPMHYVVVDRATKSVVVCLRGTLGISDLVTDLAASYQQYISDTGIEGFLHSGMFKSAQKIARSNVTDVVAETLNKHPGYSLVLTGHSLGGGCAAMLAMLWSQRIVGNDVVPYLSLGLIQDFRSMTVNLTNERGMAERIIGRVLGIFPTFMQTKSEETDESLWFWSIHKTLRADMKAEKLYQPGTIFWINAYTGTLLVQPIDQTTGANEPAGPSTSRSAAAASTSTALISTDTRTQPVSTTPITCHQVDDVVDAFSELVFSTKMFTDQLWDFKSLRDNHITSEDQMETVVIPPLDDTDVREYPKTFCFIGDERILTVTNTSRFLLSDLSGTQQHSTELHIGSEFASYVDLAASPSKRFVVAGNISGRLALISPDQSFPTFFWDHQTREKIFRVDVFDGATANHVHVFVFTRETAPVVWYRVTVSDQTQVVVQAELVLAQHMHVSAMAFHEVHRLILIGTRRGAMAVYDASDATSLQSESTTQIKPAIVCRHMHGKDSVTSIVVLPADSTRDTDDANAPPALPLWKVQICTTGRDGMFSKYILSRRDVQAIAVDTTADAPPTSAEITVDEDQDSELLMPQVGFVTPVSDLSQMPVEEIREGWWLGRTHHSRITKGWLERIIVVDGVVLLSGFYDMNFFVYNETKKYEMLSVACGGGHRHWEYQTRDALLLVANFAFIRNSKVLLVRKRQAGQRPFLDSKLQDNYHGRETRVVRFIHLPDTVVDKNAQLLVSAGEDGLLTFHSCKPYLHLSICSDLFG